MRCALSWLPGRVIARDASLAVGDDRHCRRIALIWLSMKIGQSGLPRLRCVTLIRLLFLVVEFEEIWRGQVLGSNASWGALDLPVRPVDFIPY